MYVNRLHPLGSAVETFQAIS